MPTFGEKYIERSKRRLIPKALNGLFISCCIVVSLSLLSSFNTPLQRPVSECLALTGIPLFEFHLGLVCEQNDDIEAAKYWYEKAANKDFSGSAINLGSLYLEEGNIQEAREWYQRAADKNNPKGYWGLGRCCSEEGDYLAAIENYETGRKKGAEVPSVLIGNAYYNLGDYQVAKQYYQEEIENGDTSEGYYGLAICQQKEGDMPAALSNLETSANQGNPLAAERLGDIYSQESNSALALQWYETAKDNGSESAESKIQNLS